MWSADTLRSFPRSWPGPASFAPAFTLAGFPPAALTSAPGPVGPCTVPLPGRALFAFHDLSGVSLPSGSVPRLLPTQPFDLRAPGISSEVSLAPPQCPQPPAIAPSASVPLYCCGGSCLPGEAVSSLRARGCAFWAFLSTVSGTGPLTGEASIMCLLK